MDVVRFLKHLLRQISGKRLVIWDGAPIHLCQPIEDVLRQGGAERIHLEHVPAYAPEDNPYEGTWHYLKRVELCNLVCHPLVELHDELRLATARRGHKPEALSECIRHAGLAMSSSVGATPMVG